MDIPSANLEQHANSFGDLTKLQRSMVYNEPISFIFYEFIYDHLINGVSDTTNYPVIYIKSVKTTSI